MRVYKITPEPGFNPCVESDPRTIVTWLEEAEVDDVFTVKVLDMTKREYDALPEYTGP